MTHFPLLNHGSGFCYQLTEKLLCCALTCSRLLAVCKLRLQAVEFGWVLIVTDISSGHRIHIQTHATKAHQNERQPPHQIYHRQHPQQWQQQQEGGSDGAEMQQWREANQWCYSKSLRTLGVGRGVNACKINEAAPCVTRPKITADYLVLKLIYQQYQLATWEPAVRQQTAADVCSSLTCCHWYLWCYLRTEKGA